MNYLLCFSMISTVLETEYLTLVHYLQIHRRDVLLQGAQELKAQVWF